MHPCFPDDALKRVEIPFGNGTRRIVDSGGVYRLQLVSVLIRRESPHNPHAIPEGNLISK